jgi:predicted RNase H-like nuclease (RuvC/YqgF family)
LEGGA